MGTFVITKNTQGQFHFNLKAGNGEIILSSELYQSENGCYNGIASVKQNAPFDERYERLRSTNDKYYFNLKAANGEIIGTSQLYQQASGMENGIASVMNNAPQAAINDES